MPKVFRFPSETPVDVPQISSSVSGGFTSGSVVFIDSSGNLNQDNSNFFWDDTNNRLGIGTNSPGASIDVEKLTAGVNELLRFTYGNAIGSGGRITWSAEGIETAFIKHELAGSNAENAYLAFATYDATGLGLAEKVRIKGNGNVGIGLTDPQFALQVSGTAFVSRLAAGGEVPDSVGQIRASFAGAINDNEHPIARFSAGSDATLGGMTFDIYLKPSATAANRYVAFQGGDNDNVRPFIWTSPVGMGNGSTPSLPLTMTLRVETSISTKKGIVVAGAASQSSNLFEAQNSSSTVLLSIQAGGHLEFDDGVNVVFDTTTGTKIGTATSQKIGFWNATPVVQPTTIADADGTLADITTKFNSLLSKLETIGILAA